MNDLQILHEMGDFHGAAMFYRACIEAEALPPPNLIPAATSTSDRRRLTMSRDMLPLETLVQSIYIVRSDIIVPFLRSYLLSNNNFRIMDFPSTVLARAGWQKIRGRKQEMRVRK